MRIAALTTRRRRESGVVRVEVQVPSIDASMPRDLANVLRGDAASAQAMRAQLRSAIAKPKGDAVFDIFGSDLPDAWCAGVFEESSQGDNPRDVDL
ncbi:MAG: hypothetical protein EXR07_04210 [Acetobacteraceae bacterium]|nr:hypothetical protein [Acetobacteraceae bacterium]